MMQFGGVQFFKSLLQKIYIIDEMTKNIHCLENAKNTELWGKW